MVDKEKNLTKVLFFLYFQQFSLIGQDETSLELAIFEEPEIILCALILVTHYKSKTHGKSESGELSLT